MFELAFISPPDIMVVMVVALLVFGPNRLPEVGRQVGQFIREGKKMMSSFTDAVNDVHNDVRSPFTDITVPGEVVKEDEAKVEPVTEESGKPQLTISEHSDAGHTDVEAEPSSKAEEKPETKD